jgi:hypothetical protein
MELKRSSVAFVASSRRRSRNHSLLQDFYGEIAPGHCFQIQTNHSSRRTFSNESTKNATWDSHKDEFGCITATTVRKSMFQGMTDDPLRECHKITYNTEKMMSESK